MVAAERLLLRRLGRRVGCALALRRNALINPAMNAFLTFIAPPLSVGESTGRAGAEDRHRNAIGGDRRGHAPGGLVDHPAEGPAHLEAVEDDVPAAPAAGARWAFPGSARWPRLWRAALPRGRPR